MDSQILQWNWNIWKQIAGSFREYLGIKLNGWFTDILQSLKN
jgi:hypothetical protein